MSAGCATNGGARRAARQGRLSRHQHLHLLRPRIGGLQIAAVGLCNGNHALVLRVPRSWNPPHRVVAHGSNRFYARAGAGKYQPDVDQLRELFAVAPTLAERIRDFRFDRLAKIKAGETPLRDVSDPVLVLHVIPYDAFSRTRRLGVPELRTAAQNATLLGDGKISLPSLHCYDRPNLDGLLVRGDSRSSTESYVQLWRTGPIEAACKIRFHMIEVDHIDYLSIPCLERACVTALAAYVEGLQSLGTAPPCAIFVTLFNVRDRLYMHGERLIMIMDQDRAPFQTQDVVTSDVTVERWPPDRQAVPALLRPALDEIANAAGLDASLTFDADGRWVVDGR